MPELGTQDASVDDIRLERGAGCESSREAGLGRRSVELPLVQEPRAGRVLHCGHLHPKGWRGDRGEMLDDQTTDDGLGADVVVPAATAAAAVDQADATGTGEPGQMIPCLRLALKRSVGTQVMRCRYSSPQCRSLSGVPRGIRPRDRRR